MNRDKLVGCLLVAMAIMAIIALAGCGGSSGGDKTIIPGKGRVVLHAMEHQSVAQALSRMAGSRALSDVTKLHIKVKDPSGAVLFDQTVPFTFDSNTDPAAFNVTAGPQRLFFVEALRDNGTVEVLGSVLYDVTEFNGTVETVTHVQVVLQPPTGDVNITGVIHDISGVAGIAFDFYPAYGTFDDLRGHVINVRPQDVKVLVYILVQGHWWVKPYANSQFTLVMADGTWVTDITTGGIDEQATVIEAFLVPGNFPDQPVNTPPSSGYLATCSVTRTPTP